MTIGDEEIERQLDEEIEHQLQLGESSHWEFKQVKFEKDAPDRLQYPNWRKEIIAFANTHGGTILFGVTDDREIEGMTQLELKNLNEALANISNNTIEPPIQINASNHMFSDGKCFLLVEVPEGESVHHGREGAYRRSGSSKRKMTGEDMLLLAQKRGQARFRWFDGQPVPKTSLQTLDESLWKTLLKSESASDPEIGLEKIRMLAQDEHGVMRATVAGILICSKVPEEWLPDACIRATHYRGNDQASGQLNTNTFRGPVNSQIVEALSFVRRNMQVATHKEPDRIVTPPYSVNAIFEAIVNAVAHRDYSIKGSSIRLLMFKNRLEIYSPGALPGNLTIAGMPDRQLTRNEALVFMLGRMQIGNVSGVESRQFFIEQMGAGVRIILRETQELSGELPKYRLIEDSELCLVIPAASVETSQVSAVISTRLDNSPLPNINIFTLFSNHTWKQVTTDERGEATLDLHSTQLPMTVLAAANGFGVQLIPGWVPADQALEIQMLPLPYSGSVIFPEATGQIPRLEGSLNPILDSHGRGTEVGRQMTRSATGRRWELPDDAADRSARLIAQRHDLPYLLACVLAMRGVEVEEVPQYLDPDLRELTPDPFCMKDMEPAARRFVQAVRKSERIAVFGDYDVDGASSIALLISWLRCLGQDAKYHVPHRRDEGYGPGSVAMEKLGRSSDLVLTVDCGSSLEAEKGMAAARAAGADVLVLDHHFCPHPPTSPLAVVNPKRAGDESGLQDLCAAGVVYMFLLAAGHLLEQEGWFRDQDLAMPDLDQFLDLVALATVADVVPLRGLNRVLVQRGLICLAGRKRVGLAALGEQLRLRARPDETSISWNISPVLNAPGRIGEDPSLAAALLLARDPVEADLLAQECKELNLQRRSIQEEVLESAEQNLTPTQSGILHWSAGAGWHPGVVSSVAGRLADRLHLPVIALGMNGETATGSGRAPPGLDLGAAVLQASKEGSIRRGGGHAAAVGLVVEQAQIEEAMERVGALLAEAHPTGFEPDFCVPTAGLLTPLEVTVENYEALQRTGPHGKQAPPPKFILRGMRVTRLRLLKNQHYHLQLTDGTGGNVKAMAFSTLGTPIGEALSGVRRDDAIDAMGTLAVDDYGGVPLAYIRLEDIAFP